MRAGPVGILVGGWMDKLYPQSGTQEALSKAWLVVFAYFHRVNTPTMANFKYGLNDSKHGMGNRCVPVTVLAGMGWPWDTADGSQEGHQER